ncbi:hypothetical protein LTR03_002231 [Friedmanniomyces endolithicus]|nr:hypothetical protein LTR03_002231 [Friedmanniomyces endolithicus]
MSSSTLIKRVVLVGATGAVGAPVLQTLVDQHFDVTVFTRASSNHSFPSNVHVANVNYEDVASMTKALQGQDALISTIGFGGATLQKHLLDAAIAAGVKRFLPSEFGCDTHNPRVAAIPLFRTKLDIDEYMDEKVKGTGTTYTCVYTNAFLDWGLVNNGLLLDLPGKKIQMIDGGETPFTANSLDFIAKGTVAVLKHPDETANRAVRLNGAVVTLNQVLQYAKKYAGAEGWEVDEVTTEALEHEGMKNFKARPEDLSGYMMQFIKLAIYGSEFGGNFDGNNDNALLGLKKMSDGEVEQLNRLNTDIPHHPPSPQYHTALALLHYTTTPHQQIQHDKMEGSMRYCNDASHALADPRTEHFQYIPHPHPHATASSSAPLLTLWPTCPFRRVSCNAPLAHIPGDRVSGPWRWVHARPSEQERARALARIVRPIDLTYTPNGINQWWM